MTVLRSREIPPSNTPELGFILLSTPSKTTESSSNPTDSIKPDPNSTPTCRRSLRLASKYNIDDVSPIPPPSIAIKRRKIAGGVKKTTPDNKIEDFGSDLIGEISGSVRVLDCDLMVEETLKKFKEDDFFENDNEWLSLRSGFKVSKKESDDRENDAEIRRNDKGKGKAILIEEENDEIKNERKFSREEKGKGVMVDTESDSENVGEDVPMEVDQSSEMGRLMDVEGFIEDNNVTRRRRRQERLLDGVSKNLMEQHKTIAKQLASKYAHYNAEEFDGGGNGVDDDEEEEEVEMAPELPAEKIEDWPGPVSTAMKIIRDRENNLKGRGKNPSSVKELFPLVSWTPREERSLECGIRVAPSLISLCMDILAQNVDAITSLRCVPEALRNKLCRLLCDSRKMNPHFLSLLLDGSSSEIRLADCSWLEERVFEKSFESCDIEKLTVLQLDLCGHCLSDSSLRKALLPKGLKALTAISLKGACRISDVGLAALVSSAPSLRSMNLSQCTLLTDVGIESIANSLGSILQELYLDECDTLNAMCILPKLKRLKTLEVLSLRGIVSVSDKFIRELFKENGQNMRELILAHCLNLTDSSLKFIADKCSQLRVLDLSNLGKLTDIGMAYITNGCKDIQVLKLCRSPFSDDAISAFLEISGKSLKELCLNSISKVGQNTTISLAGHCKNLESLDLSWCRLLTDKALGFIADNCSSLMLLKLFGCSQVTSVFVDGHSNPHLHIVGLKLTPILKHIKRPDFQQGP